jgi:transcription elongation factor Elf1
LRGISVSDDEFDDAFRPAVSKTQVRFREWNCPICDANNPVDDGFRHSDELMCSYCGLQFRVQTTTEKKFSLIPI